MLYSVSATRLVDKTVSWNSLEETINKRGVKEFTRERLNGKVLAALDDYTILISESESGKHYKVEIYELL